MDRLLERRLAGLSTEEAGRRLVGDGPNELPSARPRNLLAQAWEVVRQPMLLLLLGAGVVNFVLSEPLDGAVLLSFVLVVIGISIYQARKTENALAALRELSSPRALVVRDGREIRVAGTEVVRGDVLVLGEGDRVPADGVLLESVNLHVDESTLTGESVPVRKRPAEVDVLDEPMGAPGGDDTPWVFSGTLVVKGHGHAVVGHTGAHTELGRIGAALSTIESERTPLQREIDRLVRYLAVLGLVAAALVAVVYALSRGVWLEGILAGLATAMAMLPEEFPVVLTVFLALGAWRMSQTHVLTRQPAVIEALGSATVLCVDKTGTLTMNAMTVHELIVDGQRHTVDHSPLPTTFHELAEYSVLASPVASFDPMDQAFRALADSHLDGTSHLHSDWGLVREYALSERLLALTHVWQAPADGGYVVAAKGAPEAIADLCRLGASERRALTDQVEEATSTGQRVLAVARAYAAAGELPDEPAGFRFVYLGLVGLRDPVRPGVSQAVAECLRAGVRTVMITGDYAGTALAVAREIGIDDGGGCITGPELATLDDEELARRAPTVNVYARMVPAQKLRLVRALKANGEVVGMTGDGVNDAPALRAADIGIAMGARGTDVAREAAALVITDDDYASITSGVRLGRGIFANLRKAMAYIVAVHVPIVGMSLVPVFVADWPLVLLPALIAFLELIIDPACSVVFEAEQVDPRIMEEPPRAAKEPILGARQLGLAALQGLTVLAAVLGVYVWGLVTDRPDDEVRSVTFATLVVGNLALILVNRSWHLPIWRTFRERRNRALTWILLGAPSLLAVLLAVPWLRTAFDLAPVTMLDVAVAVLAGFAGVVWFEVYKLLGRRTA